MAPVTARLGHWFDRLLPPQIREGDADSVRRGRLVILAALAAVVWGPPFAVMMMRRGVPEIGTILAAQMAVIAIQPIILRVTGSLALVANLILAGLFCIVLLAGAQGGLGAPGLVWLAVMPIGGILLAGRRSGAVWSGIAVATILGLYFLDNGEAVPILEAARPESFRLVQALNLLAILSVVTVVALRSVREKDHALGAMAVARDEADAAGEAKMRFLAAMSHEIRTPMNGTLGMSDLLLRSELSGEQRRLAEGIYRSGQALLSVIHDVLDISRIESGRLPLERTDFGLRELVDDVQEIVRESARAKDLDLTCSIAPEVPGFLRGDAGRVRQVLLNLVANAVRFTAHGSVELKVSVPGEVGGEERFLRFEVRDTGIGVPAERVEHIFDRFTQADDSTLRRFGGSGLGLSIAKQLTHRMGGEIGVQAGTQGGSTFWFTLPLASGGDCEGLVEVPKNEAKVVAPASPEPARPAAARILLAEDNPVNKEVAVAMLESLGHRVAVVGDGRRALDALERSRFDLVLMDCEMPDLNGFDATTRLRENEARIAPAAGSRTQRVPVVALTASAMQGDRERCLAAGMDDYLSKPFTLAELGSTLARWLPEVSSERPTHPPSGSN